MAEGDFVRGYLDASEQLTGKKVAETPTPLIELSQHYGADETDGCRYSTAFAPHVVLPVSTLKRAGGGYSCAFDGRGPHEAIGRGSASRMGPVRRGASRTGGIRRRRNERST